MAKAGTKKTAASTAPVEQEVVRVKASAPFTTNKDITLRDLFVSGLREMYWAENHLAVVAIPKMIASASDKNLKKGLTNHLAQTKTQVGRLEQAFELLGEPILPKKCDALEGLAMSGENTIENTPYASPVRDMGITMSGMKVENFEITSYTGLIQLANQLDQPDVVDLLQENLDEEIAANDQLSEASKSIDFENR